jgi:hypothetical protein
MVSCRQLSRPAPFSMIRSAWVMVSMSAGEALVVVGVQVGLEQAGHLDPVAADVGGEAGHLGGGGHHPQGLTAGLLRRAGRPVGGAASSQDGGAEDDGHGPPSELALVPIGS